MKQLSTLLIAVFLFTAITPTLKAQVNTQDSLALVDLYDSTGGPNWTINTNWLTSTPVSSWYGITVIGGRVNGIELANNNLIGSIPFALSKLTNLQFLRFDQNKLNGSIPSWLGNLTQLIELGLNNNQLIDTIPSSLGYLTNLSQLYLTSNQLSGNIPSSLGNLKGLYNLLLDYNHLSSTIPPSLGNLTNLLQLALSNNQLSDTIPSTLGNLVSLTHLGLDNNQLSGTIPSSLGNLVSLTGLTLNNNQLRDTIPSSLSNLANLTALFLSNNQLSGIIPSWLGNLSNLTLLTLNNNHLSGTIPSALGNLANLEVLELYNNQLSGTIPSSLGNLTKLTDLWLQNNKFTFDGMELIATKFPFAQYGPQAPIPLHSVTLIGNSDETILNVSVGGTPTKNVYNWFNKSGIVATINKDSAYEPLVSDYYYVHVKDSLVLGLTLHSDTLKVYTTVPIKSINLQAKETNGQVLLQWQTIDEINTASFTIQHSTDGKTFSDIATKEAVGSGNNGYSFSPPAPIKEVTYYRIKAIDKDGSFSCSNVASVQFTANSNQLTVYPNPSRDNVTISGSHIASVQVIDNSGRIVKVVSLKDATNPTIKTNDLAAGVYYLHIKTTDGGERVVSFVKNSY